MGEKKSVDFDFGKNWQDFSERSLGQAQFTSAVESLDQLIGKGDITGKSFLDIGCGSGVFAILASFFFNERDKNVSLKLFFL